MSLFEQRLTEEFETDSHGISVKYVTKEEFAKIKNKFAQRKTIEMEYFEELSDQTAIENLGAAPCFIAYAHNKKTGEIISGHFPEIFEERFLKFFFRHMKAMRDLLIGNTNDGELIKPTDSEIQRFGISSPTAGFDKGYDNFLVMMEEIKKWVQNYEDGDIELFLFGQNGLAFGKSMEEYASMVVDDAIDQHNALIMFHRLGIPLNLIHDFRTPGIDKTDDTFYDPQSKTIYYSYRRFKPGKIYQH